MKDIFLCHASEDKEEVARPLFQALTNAGILCWFDEAEIVWGDSISQKVNEGLRVSRYAIVVLSLHFSLKEWPQKEMYAFLNEEASSGGVRVLPLLVGTGEERAAILTKFPLLKDKYHVSWEDNPRSIVQALLTRLGKKPERQRKARTAQSSTKARSSIDLSKIRITQHDKDMFLQTSYKVIRQYFKKELTELARKYEDVKTSFSSVTDSKFICTVYIQGEIAKRSKIWLGAFGSSNSIGYYAGQLDIESDTSFNEELSVVSTDNKLGFKPLGLPLGRNDYNGTRILNPEEAAAYLWSLFIDGLR